MLYEIVIVVLSLALIDALSLSRYQNRVIDYNNLQSHKKFERLQEQRCRYNMCEHVDNYPEDRIRQILEKNVALRSYFGNIIEPTSRKISIENRFGEDIFNYEYDGESFCKTIDVTARPKIMKDIQNVDRSIANIDGFNQVIKFQTCDNGKECFAGTLLNYSSRCVQQYNIIKLITVNMATNASEYHKFQIPSTCLCKYVKTKFV